jgi:hypothetical protein
MTHEQRWTAYLIFIAWAHICILNGAKSGVGTESSLSDRPSAVIYMKLREGKGDTEAGHWHLHSQCPQKVCMACG